jgi:ribosomal-protein-alanine N-acetyltransferase
MSAQLRNDARDDSRKDSPADGADRSPQRVLVPMAAGRLDAVLAIEASAYAFPWSRGNFIDSLAAGYPSQVLLDSRGEMLGYLIAMHGVDETHLLNITVAPPVQGQGHARFMIDALTAMCVEQRSRKLWLEVRESNAHARAMYEHMGFVRVGRRKGYYPAPLGRREDAVVMSLQLDDAHAKVSDALE